MIGQAIEALKRGTGFINRCYLAAMTELGRIDKNSILIFDSVDSETWNSSATISQYAVERGEDISDHIKLNPQSLTLNGIFTNHTLLDQSAIPGMSFVNKYTHVEDSISQRLEQLDEWRKQGSLLIYRGAVYTDTESETVKNLVITRMSPSKKTDTGEAVEVSITLQRAVIASATVSGVSIPSAMKKTRQKGLVNKTTVSI